MRGTIAATEICIMPELLHLNKRSEGKVSLNANSKGINDIAAPVGKNYRELC